MSKIVYLLGKSSSGKDTIYKKLLEEEKYHFETVVLYTTRPIRAGEMDGTEYYFVDDARYQKLKAQNMVIEERSYDTVQGLWRYFTVFEGQLELDKYDYLMIGTLESYQKTKEYLGEEKLVPVFIDLDDGERLQRALDRERSQENPQYSEMCRRFLADMADFTEEKIENAGIQKRFMNQDLQSCLTEIKAYLDQIL